MELCNYLEPFFERLKSLRQQVGLTLRELGTAVEVCYQRLGRLERPEGAAGPQDLTALASFYRMEVAELTRHSDHGFSPSQALRRGRALEEKLAPPRPAPPSGDWPFSRRLKAARNWSPSLVARLETAIDQSPASLELRVFLRDLWCDSGTEGIAWMHYAAAGFEVVLAALLTLGFRDHPIVCPRTDRSIGDVPIYGLSKVVATGTLVIFPQVTLFAAGRPQRVDMLARFAPGAWGAIEVDGEAHNSSRDKKRARDLNIPIWRLSTADVLGRDLVGTLVARAQETWPWLASSPARRV